MLPCRPVQHSLFNVYALQFCAAPPVECGQHGTGDGLCFTPVLKVKIKDQMHRQDLKKKKKKQKTNNKKWGEAKRQPQFCLPFALGTITGGATGGKGACASATYSNYDRRAFGVVVCRFRNTTRIHRSGLVCAAISFHPLRSIAAFRPRKASASPRTPLRVTTCAWEPQSRCKQLRSNKKKKNNFPPSRPIIRFWVPFLTFRAAVSVDGGYGIKRRVWFQRYPQPWRGGRPLVLYVFG